MTDYLGKLIKRSQTHETAIRPRPVARFEPTAPMVQSEPAPEERVGGTPGNDMRPYRTPIAVASSQSGDTNPFVKIQGIHTIYMPPWNVSLNDAEKIAVASAAAGQGPAFEQESRPFEGPDETLLEKPSPDTGIQVRPANIRLLPETGFSETVAPKVTGLTAQSPEPDINVTIGRVEVRAVMPREQKPIVRPKRTAPSLTLDDYLKKREA